MQEGSSQLFKPPTSADAVLAEVVRRLVEVYRPERIYLFGSVARGDAGADSDYDMMIIVPDDASRERRDPKPGYRALSGLGVAVDVQVWPHTYFQEQLHLRASLPSTIRDEGKLVYGG